MTWGTPLKLNRIMEIVSIIFKPKERDTPGFFRIMTRDEELPVFDVDTENRKVFIGADTEVRGEASFYRPINLENQALDDNFSSSPTMERKILRIKVNGKDAYIPVWVDMAS